MPGQTSMSDQHSCMLETRSVSADQEATSLDLKSGHHMAQDETGV
jgi:hypothetical protein